MFIDSHCHLSFPELAGDLDAVLARMGEQRVVAALNVCVTLEEFDSVHAVARRYANVYASVGVHPDYQGVREPDPETLVALAQQPKVVAIGETGLDYFRLPEPLQWQRQRFRAHIRAARACGKPLIVHTRAAAADTLTILREEGAEAVGGVMHCFTESQDFADAVLELGFHISFSGIVTFRSASALQQVAARVPLERLLIETDSPYLSPVPHRGKANEPSRLPWVAAKIAALRDLPVETIARAASENFLSLFKIIGRFSHPVSCF